MFHDESWKSIHVGIGRWKLSYVTSHKNSTGVIHCTIVTVSAGFFLIDIFCIRSATVEYLRATQPYTLRHSEAGSRNLRCAAATSNVHNISVVNEKQWWIDEYRLDWRCASVGLDRRRLAPIYHRRTKRLSQHASGIRRPQQHITFFRLWINEKNRTSDMPSASYNDPATAVSWLSNDFYFHLFTYSFSPSVQ